MLGFNKQYESATGAVRTPLYYSECKRFIFVECSYKNGMILKKWFWSNHRLFISYKKQ